MKWRTSQLCISQILPAWLIAVILGANAASYPACAQQSINPVLSAPLSSAIGDPVYSESLQTGPSSSLIPGDNNLLNPDIHTGPSDPLFFLIEDSYMSPYLIGSSAATSYANATLPDQPLLNDSVIASHVTEYRNNRVLMAGAGVTSTPVGSSAAAGGMIAAQSGISGNAISGFSRIGMAAPFAAGSSGLPAKGGGSLATASFVDPNALAVESSSAAGVALMQSDPDAAAAALAGGVLETGASVSADNMGLAESSMQAPAAVLPTSMILTRAVPPATSVPIGASPGALFPNVSMAFPPGGSFPDSTKATAGLPYPEIDIGFTSPLLATQLSSTNVFPDVSAEDSNHLHPLLLGAAEDAASAYASSGYGSSASMGSSPMATSENSGASGQSRYESLREVLRKARLRAMIDTPGTPAPSPFEIRSMQKQYMLEHKSRALHHRPSTLTSSTPPTRP